MKLNLKSNLLLFFSALILILLLPWQLIPYNVDNAWILSMYHNPLIKNLPSDITFGSGSGALPWFGESLVPLFSIWFGSFGWELLPAIFLSRIFLFLGGWLFFVAFLKSGLSRFTSVLLTLALMASEPVLLAGGFIRPESFLFMMTGLIALLVLSGYRFIPVLLAFLCFEIHPIAVMLIPFTWILIFRFGKINNNNVIPEDKDLATDRTIDPFQNNDSKIKPGCHPGLDPGSIISTNFQTQVWRFLVITIITGSIAIAFYLTLHSGTVSGFIGNIQSGVAATSGTALSQLFNFRLQLPGDEGFNLVWSRVAEIGCWGLLLVGVLWMSLKKKLWFPPVLIGWIFLADFINPKGNQYYTLYYAIFLIWALSELIRSKQHFLPVLAGLTILVFSVWKVSYVATHTESVLAISQKSESSRSLISVELPKSAVILGSPEAWFIYRDYRFYASAYTGLTPDLPDTIFLTREKIWEQPPAGFKPNKILEKITVEFNRIEESKDQLKEVTVWVRKQEN